MYCKFFGLSHAPFRITPDTDCFFDGGNRGPILEALIYAVTHGEGIVKVSGEVGSGKTMLCNTLMERLPRDVETVFIANPNVSPDEILYAIAYDLQLGTALAATRLEVMHALQDYLLKRHAEGRRVVMLVEEAQGMPLATLEELRLLSNLETRHDKLLQMVLFGQPELDVKLHRPEIRQLRDRIRHNFMLRPFSAVEIGEYLRYRLRAAGYSGPELFPPRVVNRIARASAGLTRRVNVIADKSLLEAYSENSHCVTPQHVAAALRDCDFGPVAPGATGAICRSWIIPALAGAAASAVGIAWFYPRYAPQIERASDPLVSAPAPSTVVKPNLAAHVTSSPPAGGAPLAAGAQDSLKNRDILKERLDATTLWVARRSKAVWTVQILSTASEDDLRHELGKLENHVEINNIFAYRHAENAAHVPLLSVLLGSYDSRAAAERTIAELPAHLKSNRPFARSVQSIRDGMQRFALDITDKH